MIFFTQWVTKLWKALLRDVVDGRGLNGFVEDLDKPVEAWSVKGCSMQRLNLGFKKSLEALFAGVPESSGKMWCSACPVLTLFLRRLLSTLFGGTVNFLIRPATANCYVLQELSRMIWDCFPDVTVSFSWWYSQQVNSDPRTLSDVLTILCRHFIRVTQILSEILI